MRNPSLFRSAKNGVVLLLCLFPFFITDTYQNLTITKFCFFVGVSALYTVICFIKNAFHYKKETYVRLIDKSKKSDAVIGLLMMVVFFSTIASEYSKAALTGNIGRYMGLIIWVAFGLAYFFISKFYLLREKEFRRFAIATSVMCLYGMLQFMGFDPFYMFSGVDYTTTKTFIAFIGNINVYAGYLCLAVPLFLYMFCLSSKPVFWGVAAFIGFFGMFTSNSDCAFLGIFVAFLVLFYLLPNEKKYLIRFFTLLAITCLSSVAFKLIYLIFEDKARHLAFLTKLCADFRFSLPILAALIILIFILNKVTLSEKLIKTSKILLSVMLAMAFLCVVAAIIWFTYVDPERDLGALTGYLRFNNRWGSDRGYIWKTCVKMFSEFPLHKKLIGLGPDTLVIELQRYYREDMFYTMFFYYDNAHNELLQYLTTIGLWGTLLYLALVFLSVRSCLKSSSNIKRALILPIAAYFIQSIANIHQPISTPLFFVMLALSQCEIYEDKIYTKDPAKENLIEPLEENVNENKQIV